MTYKVGSTTVIESDAKIDWSRIKNHSAVTSVGARIDRTIGSGDSTTLMWDIEKNANNQVRMVRQFVKSNCNCNCNCDCFG